MALISSNMIRTPGSKGHRPPPRYVPGRKITLRERAIIFLPYVWMILFFLIPFLIIFKISFSVTEIAIPPYSPIVTFEEGATILSHPNQKMTEISKDHSEKIVGEGPLVLKTDSVSVGDKVIHLSEIRDCDIFYHGFLLISTKDKKYYEISNPESKYPGYLYKLLIKRFVEGGK